MNSNQSIPIYIAGDSTVQTYSPENAPQAGWGQFISDYFTNEVNFHNHAMGGRSSKTFVEEGRLNTILQQLQPGDWLLIQMGHNDANQAKPERYTEPFTEFQRYLSMYLDGAQEKGAFPLLITPVARLNYKNGDYANDFPEYCESMKQLGARRNVPVIDLMNAALLHYQKIGFNAAREYYMASFNGTDYTHFNEHGARQIAALLAEEIREMNILLSRFVKEKGEQV